MKKQFLLFTLTLLLFSSCMSSKVINMEDNPYVKVYDGLGLTQDELFLLSNEWLIKNFVDAESVIQYRDKEAGVVIGKFLMYDEKNTNTYATYDNKVYSIIDIRSKNDKFRISIAPLGEWAYPEITSEEYQFTEEKAQALMESLASDLYHHIRTKNITF